MTVVSWIASNEKLNGASHADNAAADAIVLRILRRVVMAVFPKTNLSWPANAGHPGDIFSVSRLEAAFP